MCYAAGISETDFFTCLPNSPNQLTSFCTFLYYMSSLRHQADRTGTQTAIHKRETVLNSLNVVKPE